MMAPCYTYMQLHNCSVEDLNKMTLEFSVKQTLDNMANLDIPKEWAEEFVRLAFQEMAPVITQTCTFEYYQVLRKLYDTQERFDLMNDIFNSLYNMPALMGEAIRRVVSQMESPFPNTEQDQPSA